VGWAPWDLGPARRASTKRTSLGGLSEPRRLHAGCSLLPHTSSLDSFAVHKLKLTVKRLSREELSSQPRSKHGQHYGSDGDTEDFCRKVFRSEGAGQQITGKHKCGRPNYCG
jgi:hypothetical protein